MGELALRDGAPQGLGHFFLGREVVDGRGAVLLDPELRSAHGFWCLARADGGFWSLARFLALRARRRRKLQRVPVIDGLLGCANGVACPMRAAVGVYFQNKLSALRASGSVR